MTCEHVRWLLSLDPLGQALAHDPAALRHLDECDACRAFARALTTVEGALAARPLATPRPGFAAAVQQATGRWPRADAVERPFSRAFWFLSAAVALIALTVGAFLLQQWPAATPPAARPDLTTQVWLNPSWATDASAWLSLEADHAAQAILALMAGLIITAAAATAGYRAHARGATRRTPPAGPHV